MRKFCEQHGEFESVVEESVEFYLQCFQANAHTIYSGYFIDVTEKCNLRCKYCYYPINNKTKDLNLHDIVLHAMMYRHLAPFILTGGEPSLRKDLKELIMALKPLGPVELLTNGTEFSAQRLKEIAEIADINLSWHPEILSHNLTFLNLCRDLGVKLESVLFVIDAVEQIDAILNLCEEWRDVISSTRIKAATRVWNEQKPTQKLFVSNLWKYLHNNGAEMTWWRNNKVSFVTCQLEGIYHMLVSWYDRFNIDMMDINCAPYYQAKTGEVCNILTAMLINEGLQEGWLNGQKIKGVKDECN